MFESLTDEERKYFALIMSRSIDVIQSIVKAFKNSMGPLLANETLLERYAFEEMSGSATSRIDAMVIDFLNSNPEFGSFVKAKESIGMSPKLAPVHEFIRCSMCSAKGTEKSRFYYFTQHYMAWGYANNNERIMESLDAEGAYEPSGCDETPQQKYLDEIQSAAKKFILEYLTDPVEARLFTFVQAFTASHFAKPTNVEIAASLGTKSPYSPKQITRIMEFVTKRFAAFCIVDKVYERLSDGLIQIDGKNLTHLHRFMISAGVLTEEDAMKVLKTERVKRERYVKEERPDSAELIECLKAYCRSKGIKFREGKFSKDVVMKIYWSAKTGELRKSATTFVFSSGAYRDFLVGQNGHIAELLK